MNFGPDIAAALLELLSWFFCCHYG